MEIEVWKMNAVKHEAEILKGQWIDPCFIYFFYLQVTYFLWPGQKETTLFSEAFAVFDSESQILTLPPF